MSSFTVEKVDGSELDVETKDENNKLNNTDTNEEVSENRDVTEHVYVTFNDGVSIEDGIVAIENTVLEGQSLEVTRKDTSGNAVVIVVTTSQRKQIEKLEIVKKVKVNEAANLTENVDSAKAQESAEMSESTELKSSDEYSEIAEDGEESATEDDTEIRDGGQEDSTDNISLESSEIETSTVKVAETEDKGNGKSNTAVFGVVGIVLLLCAVAFVFLGNKKR